MNYDDKPWLKFYDEGVPAEIDIPVTTYTELMERSFKDFPNHPALHFLGITMTFGELDELSLRFADFLAKKGCGLGDVVGLCLPNTPQYMIALAGSLRAGCAVSGVSPLMSPKEMVHQLKDCGAKAFVTLDVIFELKLKRVADRLPDLTHIVATNVADFLPWHKRFLGKLLKKIPSGKVHGLPGKETITFVEIMKKYQPEKPDVSISPDDNCLIQYTGGTTGLSKGALLTHFNVSANIIQNATWVNIKPGTEVSCSGFPFFHMAGLEICLISMAFSGAMILIPNPRDTGHICSEIAKHKPTFYTNVPSLYQMLLNDPAFKSLDFSMCRICLSAAAPFSPELFKALVKVVGEGKVMEAYGMTETSPIITVNPRKRSKQGSVGVPLMNTRVKLVDLETGEREAPVGEEGELIVQGPQVMKGYHKLPEETAHVIREFQGEKWLFTGDVARMDEEGYFHIVDRAKDMLNVGGFKVFSREVEESLYEIPLIEFCAIVGLPNPKRPGSEIVKLVVQVNSDNKGRDIEEMKKEILEYCRENMSPYKVPKIIEFTDEMPLTVVGKVDKKALR